MSATKRELEDLSVRMGFRGEITDEVLAAAKAAPSPVDVIRWAIHRCEAALRRMDMEYTASRALWHGTPAASLSAAAELLEVVEGTLSARAEATDRVDRLRSLDAEMRALDALRLNEPA